MNRVAPPLLALTLASLVAKPACAQTAPPAVTELEPVAVPPPPRRFSRRERIARELLAGAGVEVGMFVSGGLIGGTIGAMAARAANPGETSCFVICNSVAIGFITGASIGAGLAVLTVTPYVVYRRGRTFGGHGSLAASALGAFLASAAVAPAVIALGLGVRPEVGGAFGIIGWLTAPVVGAVTGYELSAAHDERNEPRAGGLFWAPTVYADASSVVFGLAGAF